MTWVKVCGLTRRGDVEVAVGAGADAVGFVIDPRSRRAVDVEVAHHLMADLPVERFLVSADADPEAVVAAALASGADGIQPHGLHGATAAALASEAGLLVLRPVAVGATGFSSPVNAIPVAERILFDTAGGSSAGGTGETFDWAVLGDIGRPFVLAGGLGPDNVRVAIDAVEPWGVDASSRLEAEPGIKDEGKVVAFVTEAKRVWS